MVHTDRTSPHSNGSPLQGRNFVTVDVIGETEATTPEDIAYWITLILETFRDLSANQEKHHIWSMAELILFMVMDEITNKVQIIYSITDFLSPVGTT